MRITFECSFINLWICLCKPCLHTAHKFNSLLNNNRTLELYFHNSISAKYIPGIMCIQNNNSSWNNSNTTSLIYNCNFEF